MWELMGQENATRNFRKGRLAGAVLKENTTLSPLYGCCVSYKNHRSSVTVV